MLVDELLLYIVDATVVRDDLVNCREKTFEVELKRVQFFIVIFWEKMIVEFWV